jgi:hypothetical protein
MPKKQQLDLLTLDAQILDGLDFCRRVYDLFDQVRSDPDGIAKLRLRRTKNEKRLIKELIPIARYVQARYHEGRHSPTTPSSGFLGHWSSMAQRRERLSLRSQRPFIKTNIWRVDCSTSVADRSG